MKTFNQKYRELQKDVNKYFELLSKEKEYKSKITCFISIPDEDCFNPAKFDKLVWGRLSEEDTLDWIIYSSLDKCYFDMLPLYDQCRVLDNIIYDYQT